MDCAVASCAKQAQSDGDGALCHAHYKRRQRRARGLRSPPMHAPLQERLPSRERVLVRAVELSEASSEDDALFRVTEAKFWRAIREHMRALGWRRATRATTVPPQERLGGENVFRAEVDEARVRTEGRAGRSRITGVRRG